MVALPCAALLSWPKQTKRAKIPEFLLTFIEEIYENTLFTITAKPITTILLHIHHSFIHSFNTIYTLHYMFLCENACNVLPYYIYICSSKYIHACILL